MAALSQSEMASQGSQGGPVLLDLAKYSYATLPMNSLAPVPWIHISNTVSLVAFFETRRSLSVQGEVQERSIFKVLKDPEIMEELDLQALAREFQLAMQRSSDPAQHGKDQKVAVITKAPVIAIKYPLNEREVRRFQIRFQSDDHYYEAMKLFSRAGVRPVEAGTLFSRPRTAASNSPAVAAAAPTSQCQFASSRPATATSYSTVGTAAQRPSTCSSGPMQPPSHVSAPSAAGQRIIAPSVSDNVHVQGMSNSSSHGPWRVPVSEHIAPSVNSASAATSRHGEPVSLLNQSKPTIKPYVPRPSTVPDKCSQNLSHVLPPKRELPFERKADTPRMSDREPGDSRLVPAEPAVSNGSGSAARRTVLAATPLEPEGSPQSTNTRRRPPRRASSTRSTAPKKPRPTKKAMNKASPKSVEMPGQPDFTVPSIEEHLQEGGNAAPRTSMQEDTQALLERAAARLQKGSVQRSIAQDAKHVIDGLCPQSGTSQNPTGAADHTIPQATASSAQTTTGGCTAKEVDMAYLQLMQQPEFAHSEANMEGWAHGRSAEERKAALDKFICDAYQDKRFWNLCRLLEGRVDALMIWPRVLRNPGAEECGGGGGK